MVRRSIRPTRPISAERAGAQARPPRSPRLVALGDLLLDIVVSPARPIERGTDVPGRVAFRRGGSAANTCAAFVRAGGRATLVTCLGEDAWATGLAASLRGEGVQVRSVRRPGPSGRLAVLVEPDGERSFVTQRGMADALRSTDLRPAWFTGASVVHVPAYSLLREPILGAALGAAELARAAGALLSTDLSSRGPLLELGIAETMSRLRALDPDVLFGNRDEAATLLGRRSTAALGRLLELAPLAVVKDGRSGARVLWRDAAGGGILQIDVAAKRLVVADTTGAGDAFAAGFLHALATSRLEARGGLARDAAALRRAALAGHRAAGDALRRPRPEVGLR
jgi:sugar/nucleoside kinase (ribokinase family)